MTDFPLRSINYDILDVVGYHQDLFSHVKSELQPLAKKKQAVVLQKCLYVSVVSL